MLTEFWLTAEFKYSLSDLKVLCVLLRSAIAERNILLMLSGFQWIFHQDPWCEACCRVILWIVTERNKVHCGQVKIRYGFTFIYKCWSVAFWQTLLDFLINFLNDWKLRNILAHINHCGIRLPNSKFQVLSSLYIFRFGWPSNISSPHLKVNTWDFVCHRWILLMHWLL